MKTNYLLPNKYKPFGWVIFIMGIIYGLVLWFHGYDHEPIEMKVFSIYTEPLFNGDDHGFFKLIETGIANELACIAIIVGGMIVGFSKEKIEDEYIYKLRKDSLVWALVFNYLVLLVTIVFIYDLTFFHVLVFNMFTPLIFFIIRFNFLKIKANSHEE